MLEQSVIEYCAPTLAGIKTGNIFTCAFADKNKMYDSIRSWNKLLTKKGLRILPLRFQNNKALIYITRTGV